MKNITTASAALLKRLVNDAPNWSGSPMIDITKEERGNLTQLKRAKVLTTFVDEGIEWVQFTTGLHELNVEGETLKLDVSYFNERGHQLSYKHPKFVA